MSDDFQLSLNFGRPEKKLFKALDLTQYDNVSYQIIEGRQKGTFLLYALDEKKLYSAKCYGKYGKDYRCRCRQCPAKLIMIPSGHVYRSKFAVLHLCYGSHEEYFEERVTKTALKDGAEVKNSLYGGSMRSIRDVYAEIMLK